MAGRRVRAPVPPSARLASANNDDRSRLRCCLRVCRRWSVHGAAERCVDATSGSGSCAGAALAALAVFPRTRTAARDICAHQFGAHAHATRAVADSARPGSAATATGASEPCSHNVTPPCKLHQPNVATTTDLLARRRRMARHDRPPRNARRAPPSSDAHRLSATDRSATHRSPSTDNDLTVTEDTMESHHRLLAEDIRI